MVISLSRYIWLSLWIVLGCTLHAQTIEVEAPSEAEQGRPFSITYHLVNYKGQVEIIAPKHEGLELLYGPVRSQSSSVKIINGQVSSSSRLSITYTFLATDKGNYTISGFGLRREEGDDLMAAVHRVQVITSATGQAGMQRMNKGYLYRAIVSRSSVYEQEALPVSYKIYASSAFGIVDAKSPIYDGFISQGVTNDDGRTQLMREDYQGKSYQTAELFREVLFPQKSGKLQIPSAEVTLQVPLELEDDPFLGQMIERKLTTTPLSIEVKPLPTQGRPDDFSGAVGRFSIKAEISNPNPRTNEAFSLTYRILGTGNLKIAKVSELTFARELEVYDPNDQTEQTSDGKTVQAERTIEYNLIARHTGHYTLPALSLSFFDPSVQAYRRVSTSPIDIRVAQGRQVESETAIVQAASSDASQPYALLDIQGDTTLPGLGFVTSLLYPLSYLVLLGLFLLLMFLARRQQALRADVLGYSASRANAVAAKRLRQAKRYAQAQATEAFYEELLRALWGYMSDKLRLPTSELSRRNVREHLELRGVEMELIDAWCELIDAVEFARFAPASSERSPEELYKRASSVMARVETAPGLKR